MKPSDQLLIDAVEREDIVAVREALAQGADPSMVLDGMPLLTGVAFACPNEFLETFLDAGADVEKTDEQGMTALIFIAALGDTKEQMNAFDMLVRRGASLYMADGRSALDMAVHMSNSDMARYLVAQNIPCRQSAKHRLRGLLSKDDLHRCP